RRDALEEPRLEPEDQQLDIARPVKLGWPSRRHEPRFTRTITSGDQFAVDLGLGPQRLGETIDRVLANAARVTHHAGSDAASLLEIDPRPSLRTPHDRDRPRHVIFEIDERLDGWHDGSVRQRMICVDVQGYRRAAAPSFIPRRGVE